VHNFSKPNDERALQLMDHAAKDVMNEFKDVILAFGESDEYRLVFQTRKKSFHLTLFSASYSSGHRMCITDGKQRLSPQWFRSSRLPMF
jgi:tRNA(His) 5'-end guanylyltransferase